MRRLIHLPFLALVGCSSSASGPIATTTAALDGVVLSQPLTLDRRTAHVGDTVTGTVTLTNAGTSDVWLQDIVIAGRRPGATNAGGPYDDFTPHAQAHRLSPGQSLKVTASRGFGAGDGGTWRAYATYLDSHGTWHDGPSVSFIVDDGSGGGGGGGSGGGGGTSGGGGSGGGGGTGFVTASGGQFLLDGKPFRMIGANRYDLTSFPPGSGKFYCGNAYSDADLERLLDELHTSTKANVVRVWAFQSFTGGGTDWSSLDRVIAAAGRHGLKIIFALENEWTDCTERDPSSADGRKSGVWFGGGYRQPLGAQPLSYFDYVQRVVQRYANEPTVAMWQLMNEAESDDGAALHAFTSTMAGAIKKVDGNHLLTLGTIGGGQAGTANGAYRQLYAIPQLDVVEAHDYNHETEALPGAPSSTGNTIFSDLADARALGKPFLVGEIGIAAPTPMYPFSYADRARYIDAKLTAQLGAGSAGALVWSFYDLQSQNWGGWDFGPTDPVAAVLAAHASP